MMKYPFEVPFEEVISNPEPYVTAVFSCLVSDFVTMPKGAGFVEYPVFEHGYEAIKKATSNFTEFTPDRIGSVVYDEPISLVVLRSILGFTPPEWAYIASQKTGVEVRRADMQKMLLATRGKIFTLKTIDLMIPFTNLKKYASTGHEQHQG